MFKCPCFTILKIVVVVFMVILLCCFTMGFYILALKCIYFAEDFLTYVDIETCKDAAENFDTFESLIMFGSAIVLLLSFLNLLYHGFYSTRPCRCSDIGILCNCSVIILTMLVQVIMIFFAAAMMLFGFMFYLKSGRTITYAELRRGLFQPDCAYFNSTALLDEKLESLGGGEGGDGKGKRRFPGGYRFSRGVHRRQKGDKGDKEKPEEDKTVTLDLMLLPQVRRMVDRGYYYALVACIFCTMDVILLTASIALIVDNS